MVVDSCVEEGKSESPSYINDNNDDLGGVDYVNDDDEEYVYDENDESNQEYDENAFNNNSVCLSPCVDSDIIEQDVEELRDSNAETIDPKEDWVQKWQCLPNVETATSERAAAFAGDVRRIWTEACVGNGDESEYTSTRHTMGLPHPKGTTSHDFMMSEAMASHLPNLLARMNVAFLERVFDNAFHMRSFTPKILLEIEDKGNEQFANCDHNACCYIRFLIYLERFG